LSSPPAPATRGAQEGTTATPEPDERLAVPIRATGYLRLHVPASPPPSSGPPSARPAPLLIAIHGYRQPPAAMLAYAVSVAPPGALVVAPEGPSAFYGPRRPRDGTPRRIDYGWIADPRRPDAEARNRDLIARALDIAAARHEIDPRRTWLLGYSQGVGVAVDYFAHHPEHIAGLIALAGGVPPHGRERLTALRGRPLLWITGTRDAAYPPAYEDVLLATLRGADLRLDETVLDETHDLLEPARERVRAWLSAQNAAPFQPPADPA